MKKLTLSLLLAATSQIYAGGVEYIVDPRGDNQIYWVQRRGNTVYVTPSDDAILQNNSRRRACREESSRRSSTSNLDRLLDPSCW